MFILPPGVTLPKHLILSTPSASLTHLDDFLYYQSRRCHTVLGDGNCLFRACSHQLYATEDFHAQLRQSLHQYIEQNKSKYEAYWIDPTISYSQHLQQLKSLGSWGTQLELQAFCDYLCLPLFVCSPNFQTRAYCWGRFTPSTHTRSPNVTLPSQVCRSLSTTLRSLTAAPEITMTALCLTANSHRLFKPQLSLQDL